MKLKIKYFWLFVVGYAFILCVFSLLSYLSIKAELYFVPVILTILALVLSLAIVFALNYGIFIGKKRVVAIDQEKVKIVKHENVRRIEVVFYNEKVTALIITKNSEQFSFVWDYFYGGRLFFRKLKIPYIINEKFIKNSIKRLSQFKKVKIKNCFEYN